MLYLWKEGHFAKDYRNFNDSSVYSLSEGEGFHQVAMDEKSIPWTAFLIPRGLYEWRNKAISSSSSLLSGGSLTVPLCISEEYKDHLRRSNEDFQPLSRIFTNAIFTHEEPESLYKHYQLKANQTLIRIDKSNAWRIVSQDIELSAEKEAINAMERLQAIIQCKAQFCFGKSTKDNHWSNQREDVRVQNKEARRILIELEALAQRLGRNNI
uniref:Uncharacterized protein n=1 Tax=Tanacetum cinerariifolium TaxID=118510 RepID=A0A6L2KKQ2_TANCI|nr:hypothetical protein [Tanacetum cinerariifolium]